MTLIIAHTYLRDLFDQHRQLFRELVSLAAKDHEADPLKGLDALFVLLALLAEERRLQRHLVQVLGKEVVFIVRDHPVDDLRPVSQGVLVLVEEVFAVEQVQDGLPVGLDQKLTRFVKLVIHQLRHSLHIYLIR